MKHTQENPSCPHCKEPGVLEDGSPASFCLQCRFPLMPIAGKYRLHRLLARGGSGTVYLAKHLHLDDAHTRVIKVLETSEIDEVATRRFLREVQVTARASNASDHIVRIYDDFGHEPFLGYYYVMEYLQGEDLGARLCHNGPFALHEAIELFAQLCEAMSAAHDIGIVHRDLKPENILLVHKGDTEIVKVIDFGIARKMNTQQITAPSRSLVGTPLYMSPEQCLNQSVDHRADIYAMGLILYEMLTGETPFTIDESSQNSSLMTVMYAHIHKPPPRLNERWPALEIPWSIDQVIHRALSKQPAQRFASVEEMSEALIQALESEASSPTPRHAANSQTHVELPQLAPLAEAQTTHPPLQDAQASPATIPMQSDELVDAIERSALSAPTDVMPAFADHNAGHTHPSLSPWKSDKQEGPYASTTDDPQELLHSLDILPHAGSHTPQQGTPRPAPPLRQKPPLAASFPLNPLPSPPTLPASSAPSMVEHEQLLAHAEQLIETRHMPKGAQQFGALEAMAPQLWSMHDEWHQEEPTTALRALLALFPIVQASGDVQRFMISLRSLLKQPGLLAPALRLKALLCLSGCHKLLGQWEDAARILEDTLAMTTTREEPQHKGQLLNLLGSIYRYQGKRAAAQSSHKEALVLLQQFDDLRGVAQTHRYLANLARADGQMREADDHLRRSLQLCRQIDDRLGEGETLGHLGNLYRSQGHKEEAESAYSEAIGHYQLMGDQRGLATTRSNLGHVLMKQGQFARAAEQYQAAIEVFQLVGDRRSVAISLGHLGDLHRRRGELAQAKECHQAAMAQHRELGDRKGEAVSYNHLGATFRDEGRFHEATFHHQQAVACQEHMQDKHGMGLTHFHIGMVYLAQDQLSEANEEFDQAMELLSLTNALDGQCEILLYRGVLYHLAGGRAAASDCYLHALSLAEELHDLELEARILLFLVMLEACRGNCDRAEAAAIRATKLSDLLGAQTLPLLELSQASLALARAHQADPEGHGTQPQLAWELVAVDRAKSTDHRLAQRLLKSVLNSQRSESENLRGTP